MRLKLILRGVISCLICAFMVTAQSAEISKQASQMMSGDDGHYSYNPPREIETLDKWLEPEVSGAEVIKNLGQPLKGKDVYWSALDTYVQQWRFPSKGVVLNMETQNNKKIVLSIMITHPSAMKTTQGVGVGTPERLIWERYSELIHKEASEPGDVVVVGTIYGGTIFTITNNKVSKIFIGAAAE